MGKAVRRNQRHVNRFLSSELLVKRRDTSCDLTVLIGVNGVKILGNGELTKKLTVQANAFSASAVAKIEANGGKAEVI